MVIMSVTGLQELGLVYLLGQVRPISLAVISVVVLSTVNIEGYPKEERLSLDGSMRIASEPPEIPSLDPISM
jgi:hypothetical protein